jgi:hypothetical protein
MYGDRNGVDVSDDDEPDEGIKDEDEEHEPMPVSAAMPTPDRLVSPTSMMQSQPLQQPESDAFYRMRPLPVRHYSQPQMEEHNPYGDGSYMPRGFQPPSPGSQDPSRRSFASPGYQSPQQSLYSWQNSMVSAGPVSSNYYVTTSPQPPLAPPTAPYQLPPPHSQQGMLPPPMVQHSFDNLPNVRYDSGPALGNQLRTGSLHHPNQIPHGFQEYLHDSGPYGQNDPGMKHGQHVHTG